ncbi:TPA: hypothetical protein ACH3X1_012967 [Trebouxia sp. C0004]
MEETVAIIHSWGKILFTGCQETGDYFWGSDTAVVLRVHHMWFKFYYSIFSIKAVGVAEHEGEIKCCLKRLRRPASASFLHAKSCPTVVHLILPFVHGYAPKTACCDVHATLHVCRAAPISMLS